MDFDLADFEIRQLLTQLDEKVSNLPSSRELSLVHTKLDEARLWLREYFEVRND